MCIYLKATNEGTVPDYDIRYLRQKVTVEVRAVSHLTSSDRISGSLFRPLPVTSFSCRSLQLYFSHLCITQFCVYSSSYPIVFPLFLPCFLSSLCRMFSSQFPRNYILSSLYASVCLLFFPLPLLLHVLLFNLD